MDEIIRAHDFTQDKVTIAVRVAHRMHRLAWHVDILYIVTDTPSHAVVITDLKTSTATQFVVLSNITIVPDTLRRAADAFLDIADWRSAIE